MPAKRQVQYVPIALHDPYKLSPSYIAKLTHDIYDQPETVLGELGISSPGATGNEIAEGMFKLVLRIETTLKAHGETAKEFERRTGNLGSKKQNEEIQKTLSISPTHAAVSAVANATVNPLIDIAKVFKGFGELVLTPEGWLRLAKLIGGGIFVLWGLRVVIRESTGADPIRTGKKIAEVAALTTVIK